MSRYSSFAVVGAGYVGLPIVKALVQQKAFVLVLTRSPPKSDLPEGVKVVQLSYTNIASIARVLQQHHIEVVISTINADGLSSQNSIAEVSKGAGVKLFVPSEFGMPSEGSTEDLFAAKDKSTKYIQSIGIPTSRIYTGFFMEMILDLVGFRSNGKVNLLDDRQRNVPISFTSIDDVAGFVAYVLTKLDPGHLTYTTFRVEGERATYDDVALILGTSIQKVEEVPSPEFPLAGSFQRSFQKGGGATVWDSTEGNKDIERAGKSNYLWENHRWKNIREVILQK